MLSIPARLPGVNGLINRLKPSTMSVTGSAGPARKYLLKGIIRCAYCGMPMWAQTYNSGNTYYREHKWSRSNGTCPAGGGAIACHTIDDQIQKLVSAIKLGSQWLEEVLAIIKLKDQIDKVKKDGQTAQEKLRRMTKAHVDGLFPDEEYNRQKKLIEMELECLVVPEANAETGSRVGLGLKHDISEFCANPYGLFIKTNSSVKSHYFSDHFLGSGSL